MRRLLRKLDINRAVALGLMTQIWGLLAGPLTMFTIIGSLTSEQQGYFYTFNSVLLLQIFVEMGLVTVLIQFASHEWAYLQIQKGHVIEGDVRALSRLSSLTRLGITWYAIAAVLVASGLSIGGYHYFSLNPSNNIAWEIPWIVLCALSGMQLFLTPFNAILEGCNQVSAIYALRFITGIVSSVSIIVSLSLGAGLYSLPIAALMRLLCGAIFLICKYRLFFKTLLTTPTPYRINWRNEMLPFQWRIACTWAAGYFPSILVPVVFYYHGAKEAGLLGMTISLCNTIPSMASSWIQARVPMLGTLIAKKEYSELDKLFFRLVKISMSVAMIGSIAIWFAVLLFQRSEITISQRLLPLLPTTLLLAIGVLNTAIFNIAMYLRAHKREPLLSISVIAGGLIGFTVCIFGERYGSMGAIVSYFVVNIVWALPLTIYIFISSRTKWHSSGCTSLSVHEQYPQINKRI